VNDNDKGMLVVQLAGDLATLGFKLIATSGTKEFLERHGIDVSIVPKVHEAERPHVVDFMINGDVQLVINTPYGKSAFTDDTYIRRTALHVGIPCITTLSAAAACVDAIRSWREGASSIAALQEQHAQLALKA
jgi:carbamoyl-phosphate synthase large subunit